MILNDLKFYIPELYLGVGICFLLLIVVFAASNNSISMFYRHVWDVGFILTFIILVFYMILICNQLSVFNILFYGTVESDYLITILKILSTASLLCLIPFSYFYFKKENFYQYEFYLLVLLSFLGLILLISSSNFLMLYLGLELQSLAVYVLVSVKRNSVLSIEAGLRYFVLGSLASGLILFGITILYGLTGSISFSDFFLLFSNLTTLDDIRLSSQMASIFIIGGLLFKLSAAPFHFWAPDVYEGAFTPVAAFVATVPKIAIVGLLLRLYNSVFFVLGDYWVWLLLITSALSLIVGSIGGLYQTKIKRLLAYSTITHVGFITLALAINAVNAAIYYIIIYVIVNLALFGLIMNVRKVSHNIELSNIHNFSVLTQTNTSVSYSLAIFFFSLAGVPPLAGFFAKYYVIIQTVSAGYAMFAFFAILLSTIGAFYYLRVVRILFFDGSLRWAHLNSFNSYSATTIAFFVFVNVGFFFFSSYLFKVVELCTI